MRRPKLEKKARLPSARVLPAKKQASALIYVLKFVSRDVFQGKRDLQKDVLPTDRMFECKTLAG